MPAVPNEQFQPAVRDSIEGVLIVARWAVLTGRNVEIPGMKIASGYHEWKKFADDGFDIKINRHSVNVKQSTRRFNSVQEFADFFPKYERPILVHPTHSVTPDSVIIVNQQGTGALHIIKRKSKEYWGKRMVPDPRTGELYECYDVAARNVKWINLLDTKPRHANQ